MIISQEVQNMCPVAQGVHHGAAPIPEEAKWVKAKEVKDLWFYTWCWLVCSTAGCLQINLKRKRRYNSGGIS